FRNFLRHFLVERLVDCRQYAAIHQLSLQVLRKDAQLFSEIFYCEAFRQCHFAVLTWGFRLGLRPHVRRFESLFSLSLIPLRSIHAVVHRRTPLFCRLRRRQWWCTGPCPRTRTDRGTWRCSTALETRGRRMPRLSLPRAHWPLARSVIWATLTWGRRWRQPMFFLQ